MFLFTAVALAFIALCYYSLKSFFSKAKIDDFHSKYVLITGCDTGFGKSTAIRLDQMGFRVIAGCLTKEGKESLQFICSDRLVGVLMDVTDSKQIQDVFVLAQNLIPAQNGLWGLINNAGYMTLGPLEWFKMDDYKKMADVNLWGSIEVTKTFLPLVKKAQGRVINLSSVAGLSSPFGFGPYSITKYGIEAFSDALRREMVEWKVKVSIIEPQGFKTPLLDGITGEKVAALWDGLSDELKKEYGHTFLPKVCKKFADMLEKVCSPHPNLVVDTLIDAITSRDPAARYPVGLEARKITIAAMFPTTLQDFIFQHSLLKSDFFANTNQEAT